MQRLARGVFGECRGGFFEQWKLREIGKQGEIERASRGQFVDTRAAFPDWTRRAGSGRSRAAHAARYAARRTKFHLQQFLLHLRKLPDAAGGEMQQVCCSSSSV